MENNKALSTDWLFPIGGHGPAPSSATASGPRAGDRGTSQDVTPLGAAARPENTDSPLGPRWTENAGTVHSGREACQLSFSLLPELERTPERPGGTGPVEPAGGDILTASPWATHTGSAPLSDCASVTPFGPSGQGLTGRCAHNSSSLRGRRTERAEPSPASTAPQSLVVTPAAPPQTPWVVSPSEQLPQVTRASARPLGAQPAGPGAESPGCSIPHVLWHRFSEDFFKIWVFSLRCSFGSAHVCKTLEAVSRRRWSGEI